MDVDTAVKILKKDKQMGLEAMSIQYLQMLLELCRESRCDAPLRNRRCWKPCQAVYSATTTFLDFFDSFRGSLGFAASTIEFGVVVDIGWLANNFPKVHMNHDKIHTYNRSKW